MHSPVRRLPLDGLRPEEAEAAIAGLPRERAYIYDASNRQVAIFEGSEGYVFHDLDERERRRVEVGLLVHNHPPRLEFAADDPRFDADSFSPADWQTAVDLNLARMVAVSPTWRHELIRPTVGWLAVHSSDWHLMEMLISNHDYVLVQDAEATEAAQHLGLVTTATRWHRVNQRFALEIGATYRREVRR